MDKLVQLYQNVGEHVQAFIWRISCVNEHKLSDNVLAALTVKGFTPSVLFYMPSNKQVWNLEALLHYGDELNKHLPESDPHFHTHTKSGEIESTVIIDHSRNRSGLVSLKRKILVQNLENVKCYKCMGLGHYAYECKLPRAKKVKCCKKNK
jgi:hypothetical protein